MVVLDTSALIYWTLDCAKLSIDAAQAIEQSSQLIASSISVWEIAAKVKQDKLIIPLTIEEYTERLLQVDKLDIVALDVSTWLASTALDWDHHDPADRVIVATSKLRICPLITSDCRIAGYYRNTIW